MTITVDDMGKQMDDYLAAHAIDPTALYIVWGGANDLRNDDSAANVPATATRATALVGRLATAGARYIMVPNLPPLGDIPRYSDQPARVDGAQYRFGGLIGRCLTRILIRLMSNLAGQGFMPTIYRVDIWTTGLRFFSDGRKIRLYQHQPIGPGQFREPGSICVLGRRASHHCRPLSAGESRL